MGFTMSPKIHKLVHMAQNGFTFRGQNGIGCCHILLYSPSFLFVRTKCLFLSFQNSGGSRSRTYNVQIMSLMSYQLLYSALPFFINQYPKQVTIFYLINSQLTTNKKKKKKKTRRKEESEEE